MNIKIATHCCICGRQLIDATSVEKGIGPICRNKYNYEDAYPVLTAQANQLEAYLVNHPDYFPGEFTVRVSDAAKADDSRKAANLLVYRASSEMGMIAVRSAEALRMLGYVVLADRIIDRLVPVRIEEKDGRLDVHTPYSETFISEVRQIKGRKFEVVKVEGKKKPLKFWSVPSSARVELRDALEVAFPGGAGIGPKGIFELRNVCPLCGSPGGACAACVSSA